MDIRLYPDPVLRRECEPVEAFGDELAELARDMVETMHANRGLGLAGPQVGVSKNIAIISPDGEPGSETILVNPEIIERDGWQVGDEGCLSFPGIYIKVRRNETVTVRYQDVEGEPHELEAEGLLARAVQHELDHLLGRLLSDRMSTVQRMANRRRLRELERRYEEKQETAEAGATESA